MADTRFFSCAGPFTLGQIAEATSSSLSDPARADLSVSDVAALDVAEKNNLSFLDNKKYSELFRLTRAGACFVRPELVALAPAGTVCLINKNPYKAYAIAAQMFYPAQAVKSYQAPSAVVDKSASIGKDCFIEAGAVIGAQVKIGDRCRIGACAVIRDGVEIGDDCDIGPHVTITHALVGSKVRLHAGACIGRQGFGFAIDPAGYVAVPQLGRVVIENDVEIGANTTVDRGAGPDTVIGQGTRIDNLVQIGHNVKVGRYCIIVAQVGISGSTQLGDYVMIGGQAGIAGHLKIGSQVKVGAQAGLMRDIPEKGEYMGSPAVPIKQFMRQTATLARLATKKGSNDE
jgi:UDP-3-O-[3-hydroxymyristoyl] glucosamine N-acyltransferase